MGKEDQLHVSSKVMTWSLAQIGEVEVSSNPHRISMPLSRALQMQRNRRRAPSVADWMWEGHMPAVGAIALCRAARSAIITERRVGRALIPMGFGRISTSTPRGSSLAPSLRNGFMIIRSANASSAPECYIAALAMPIPDAGPFWHLHGPSQPRRGPSLPDALISRPYSRRRSRLRIVYPKVRVICGHNAC